MRTRTRILASFAGLLVALAPDLLIAGRCATGLRSSNPERFTPLRPAYRNAAAKTVVPVQIPGAHSLTTANFRVLWGDGYDRSDPDWADTDGDGHPQWVQVLADALETALTKQRALGFPNPFGLDQHYLDAYVGNTGLTVDGKKITISSSYYAYTEVDSRHGVAYFVVNDDFSAHVSNEGAVLRAVAAHELFHAVQHVYYPWADDAQVPESRWNQELWWFEATCTWMEEVCEPDVDDYASYVRTFLAEPEKALTSTDGLREYGAAIFPAYLWLYRGGPSLWQEVFGTAYASGVEGALNAALLPGDSRGLAGAVAAFWSLAAHPEDAWPDGAQFRASNTPLLRQTPTQYPLTDAPTGSALPARYGASLYRLPAAPAAVPLRFSGSGPFLLSASAAQSSADPQVSSAPSGLATFSTPGSQGAYLAVVNVASAEGTASFRLAMGDAANEDSSSGSGGGGGGCFLASVGLR